MFTKTIHLWFFMRKTFFVHLYDKLFLYTHHNSSFYVTRFIYIQRFFLFFSTHTYAKVHSLLTRTRIPFHASFTHRNPSIHISLLHTCIDKNLFLFLMNMTSIHNASFLFIRILVHFVLLFLGRRS